MGKSKKKRERSGYGRMLCAYVFRSFYELKIMAEGVRCEKLISEVMSRGIDIKNISVEDETTVVFTCSAVYYSEIADIAGKRYILNVIGRHGIIPSVRDFLNGRGIAAGIFLITVILIIQQFFIMEVEIRGNVGISESDIRQTVAGEGLKEYGLKKDYNTDAVKSALFDNFRDITWINIDEKGSYVLVEIVEGHKIAKQPQKDVLHDIVAAKGGYVEEIIVKNGYKSVNEGDYVEAGQLMIASGIPVNNTTYDSSRDGMIRYVDAEGIVKARVVYKLSFQCNADNYTENELRRVIGEKTRGYIRENIPELIEIRKNDLKFHIEENIIKGVVTLEVTENISIQKENEFAENVEWYNGQNDND